MEVIYVTVLAMAGLFFAWLFLKEMLYKALGKKICVICATVISTWIMLLAVKAAGYGVPLAIVAILMGESVTGFVYMFESKLGKNNKKLLVMKPAIILMGTLFIYSILTFIYE